MSENEKLEQARRARQLTLQQAADLVGVHLSTFYGWRMGTHKPHLSSLQMLCKAFDATAEELGFAELVQLPSSQQEEPVRQGLVSPRASLFAEEEGETPLNEPTIVLYDSFEIEVLADGLHWSSQASTDELFQCSVLERLRKVDTMTEQQNSDNARISRRHALRAIAKAPISLYGLTVLGATRTVAVEDVLPLCAAGLVACRELINEGDITSVKSILSLYLPALISFVQHPSYTQRAARLAAQGYLLATSVASHLGRLDKMQQFSKEACMYARQAQDVNLEVVALIRLAVTYDYAHRPRKALETYQVAMQYIDQLTPLLGSLLYARLAGKSANCAERQEALRYLALAHETFPEHPEEDPYAFLPGMGRYQLLSWDGITHKHLGQYEDAWQTFAQVGTLQPRTELSERTRLEFLTYSAVAAVGLRDMERCVLSLETAGKGSLQLGHEQRYAEACEVYTLARTVWPQEAKVVSLQDLFIRR
ncbi:MAG: helix-turn-helix transcriptional regulator [Ktedonobacteraceae bacterium]|nr:helix-turn-helix transcriptional regulator [Ktedonobacteraceae bacterium]